jgi:hypothetical protein
MMTPGRATASKLERTVLGARAVHSLASATLPLFEREDIDQHVDYLLKEDPIVAAYIARNPSSRQLLRSTVDDVYRTQYRRYLKGAKLIDSWDRVTSSIGLAAETFPGVGHALSAGEEVIELGPKALYAAWYATGTSDYAFLPKIVAAEAASFIPVVGDLVDMKNLYVDRARTSMRQRAANEFLKRVSGTSKIQ